MKTNKLLIVTIIIVVFIILVGIIVNMMKQQQDILEIKTRLGMETKKNESKIDKSKSVSRDEFIKHIEKVELTAENWRNYFEIKEVTRERTDIWGDTEKTIYKHLQLKEPYYDTGELIDVRIMVSNNTLKFEISGPEIYKISTDYISENQDISMDSINCERIKGTLYYLKDFDNTNWQIDSDGYPYVNIEGTIFYRYNKNSHVLGIGKVAPATFLKDLIEK